MHVGGVENINFSCKPEEMDLWQGGVGEMIRLKWLLNK